jgi:hypothetical protein
MYIYIIYNTGLDRLKDLGWDDKELNSSDFMVFHALDRANLLDKWHLVAVDNFYQSPALCRKLLNRETHVVGTCRSNRKGFPASMLSLPKGRALVRGSHAHAKSDAGSGELFALAFHDKRTVHMLATFPAPIGTASRKVKARKGKPFHTIDIPLPCHVGAYNNAMGGTDLTKQVISQFLTHLNTRRPTTRLFEHIFWYTVNNSRILWWRYQQRQTPG